MKLAGGLLHFKRRQSRLRLHIMRILIGGSLSTMIGVVSNVYSALRRLQASLCCRYLLLLISFLVTASIPLQAQRPNTRIYRTSEGIVSDRIAA
jgi:hypothetical protein